MERNRTIKVTITQVNGEWAYSVCIDDAFHKIGYGVEYADTAKMAAKGVKSAEKFIKAEKELNYE